ncbi:hypothetical protein FUAX_16490 [Fulvitalea axinellae]|uniref:Tc1-like transposase DDE domain-containing protein n=1 Tax=Fulvitalea axinellae TaxID=1182444 RepID=A0AAU9CUU5_9BACT|nr:hypothetical protein FUAX_16490 [Fulvitalea axinellae]
MDKNVPRSLCQVVQWAQENCSVTASRAVLSRLLRFAGYSYKRMRVSCSHKRDKVLFDFFKTEIQELKKMEDEGEIDLYSFDEMGVNLSPVVPYGWQKVGKTHRLSSIPSSNHTVVGFVNRKCDFHGFRVDGAATAETTVACINDFVDQIEKKTVVLIDNASIHKAIFVREKMVEWAGKGLFLQFIPAYSPELNFIERLWLEFKHRWLSKPNYFDSIEELTKAIDDVIRRIGTKYRINFE